MTFRPRPRAVAQTSRDVFQKIKDGGMLSKMRLVAYEIVWLYGPVTGAEIDAINQGDGGRRRGHLHKRLSELERMGLVRVIGRQKCRVTGHDAEAWASTDRLPAIDPVQKKWARSELLQLLQSADEFLGDGSPPESIRMLKSQIREALKAEGLL